jgi:hypothetical protein
MNAYALMAHDDADALLMRPLAGQLPQEEQVQVHQAVLSVTTTWATILSQADFTLTEGFAFEGTVRPFRQTSPWILLC